MHQFDRKVCPMTQLAVSCDTCSLVRDNAPHTPARGAPADTKGTRVATSPSRVLPTDRPLFSPFRSYQAIKEDQLSVLQSLANKRVGKASKTTFVAETLPSPGSRGNAMERSFNGKRNNVVTQGNSVAYALFRFIDESLGRIFAPLPDTETPPLTNGSGGKCLDPRTGTRHLSYTPHTRDAFESEMEASERSSMASSKQCLSSTSLPKSPFGEPTVSHPPAHVYHPPRGLPVLLERIRRHEVATCAPFDPANELESRLDPPMTLEARDIATSQQVSKSIRQKRCAVRKLRPLAEQSDRLDTSSAVLHQQLGRKHNIVGSLSEDPGMSTSASVISKDEASHSGMHRFSSFAEGTAPILRARSFSRRNTSTEPIVSFDAPSVVETSDGAARLKPQASMRRTVGPLVSFGDVLSANES